MSQNEHPTFDAALFTPPPPMVGETLPQPPHCLEPALHLAEDGDHRPLWALTPEGLRCYHCAWSLHAMLARAKALEEVERWRQ